MEEYAEEDIQVDPVEIENAFKRGLKRNGVEYLEEVKKMATNDYELIGEEDSISRAFESLKRYISTRGNIAQVRLKDLTNFGLSPDVVSRIGYLAFQFDSISPVNSINNRKNRTFDSKQTPDDYYADDFEEIEDEADLKTKNESFQDSADELYEKKSPAKPQQSSGNRYSRRSAQADGEGSDVSDIEEETYDMRKNVRTSGPSSNNHNSNHNNHPSTPQQASGGHMYPRISPEVQMSPRRDSREAVPALKPAVQASSAFLPVTKTGLAKSVNIAGPASPEPPNSSRASTASGMPSSRGSGSASRDSRVSRNGRIKTATWIETQSWRLGEKIGSGAFGEVFQGLNDKGTLFAVKRMNMTSAPAEVDNLLQEIQLMRGLSHPHIVAYLGAWVDAAQGNLYIFQEWVPGGSVAHLLTRFGPFSLGVVREYTRQIVRGLEYLHSNGIIHRDIKGGNILVDANRTVKLADFGASTTVSQFNQTQVTTTVKGTPYFMAPEVLANSRYGRKGDVWAVGCTMIQMLTGEPPWKDRNLKGLVQLHLLLTSWDQGPPPYDCFVSPDARECLELCFIKDDTRRPTAEALLQCKFLLDDELEDSMHSTSRDPLDDSGVITGLKQEMARVVSRSAVGIRGGSRGGQGEDTISAIDQQLQNRAARKSTSAIPSNHTNHPDTSSAANNNYIANPSANNNANPKPANPYGQVKPRVSGSNPFATPSPASPDKMAKWDVELPQSQFDSPARFSNPVSSGSNVNSSGYSNVNTPNSGTRPNVPAISVPSPSTNNPFARGANVVRKSTAFSPAAQGGSGVGSVGSGVGSVGSSGITPRLVEEPVVTDSYTPRITPRGSERGGEGRDSDLHTPRITPRGDNSREQRGESTKAAGAHGIGAAGVSPLTVDPHYHSNHAAHSTNNSNSAHTPSAYDNSPSIRDSLQVLKKRNPSASRRGTSANSNSRGNISSNRDSEDLTPYITEDTSDNETDYYYRSDDRPALVQQDSLASIEEEALAMDLHRSDDSGDRYAGAASGSNSRGNSREGYRPQQVAPLDYHNTNSNHTNHTSYSNSNNTNTANSMYTRPKTQSRESRPVVNVMKKSSSDFGHVDPSMYNNNSVSSSVSSVHSSGGVSSAGRYRRDASSPQFQVVQVEHRPKAYPLEKKSASASVRRAAPMTQAEAASRPNTTSSSKAGGSSGGSGGSAGSAYGVQGGGGGSRNSSAGSDRDGKLSIMTGRDSQGQGQSRESISRDSHSRDQHSAHAVHPHTTHPTHSAPVNQSRERQVAPAEYAYSVDESLSDDEDAWMCLGCRAENTNSSHCEHCALKRGADGKRGVGAQIHRA